MTEVDYGIGALSDCEVAQIPHEEISKLCREYPNLAYAFWRDSMVDTSILHSWALGGSRNTVERVANMLCELFVRLQAVGLAKVGGPLDFNATQRDLADALGLSLVHVNKTLKVLKTKGLIGRIGTKIEILDWKTLQKIGDFDAGFLHSKALANHSGDFAGAVVERFPDEKTFAIQSAGGKTPSISSHRFLVALLEHLFLRPTSAASRLAQRRTGRM
jgi:hypothetical protein